MDILGLLNDFWELISPQIINVPTNSFLGLLYMILNILLLLLGSVLGLV